MKAAVAAADALQAGRRARGGKAAPPDAEGGSDGAEPHDALAAALSPTEERAPKPTAGEPRASTTDAEARVMKVASGGFRPAFDVQFAADMRSGAVARVSVDNSDSDIGKTAPISDALATAYGTRPGQHLADGGYAKLADVDRPAKAGVTAFVPVPKPRDPARDRSAPRADDTEAVAAWRARMNTDDAKAIHKQRAATAERVNAQARKSGLTRFILRGLDKARAVVCWYALANTMLRAWRFASV